MIDHDSTLSPTNASPVSAREAAYAIGPSPGFYTDQVTELVSLNLMLYDIIDALGEFYDVPDDEVRAGMGLLLKDLRERNLDLKNTWEGCIDYLMEASEKNQSTDAAASSSDLEGDFIKEPSPETYSLTPMPGDEDRDLWFAEDNVRDELDALEETYYLFYQFIEALFDSESARETTNWEDAKCGLRQWKNWLRFRQRRLARLAKKELAQIKQH